MARNALLLLTILSFFTLAFAGRLITTTTTSSSSDLISDGVHDGYGGILRLNPFLSAESDQSCTQTYGFLPCTTTVLGNIFLFIVYGYLMYFAATYLSSGSELLLEIPGPGLVGGLVLPIFSALPDALLILVSGGKEAAQDQVSVGMGLLAGSTVVLLTVIWGTCIVAGKCDIENSVDVDSQDTGGFNLVGSGVSTDIWTRYSAMIMAASKVT